MRPTEKQQINTELIERAWDELESESVGAKELGLIHQALEAKLERSSVASPAQIARTLADAGIPLRHPEVLNADLAWREARLQTLFEPGAITFETIETAVVSMRNIESRRSEFLEIGDEGDVESLRDYVREIKAEMAEGKTDVTREVGHWVTIWLQNPEIFSDWLSLRLKSPEFLNKFGELS
jgi:hypothetical protein